MTAVERCIAFESRDVRSSGKAGDGMPIDPTHLAALRMAREPATIRAFRFGDFDVELETGELRKQGLRVELEGKPFQILALLLETPGTVVTRKELRETLWPAGTFVIFDRGLYTAVNKLRHALGDSSRKPRFVETLHGRGYRFIAPVEVFDSARRTPKPHAAIKSIAVLPFESTESDPEVEHLSDSITESIIYQLSQLPGVRVMARSTMLPYKGKDVDPRSVGRELRVDALLIGRVARYGDNATVGTELVDVDGWRVWGGQYSQRLHDICAVRSEITHEISEALCLVITRDMTLARADSSLLFTPVPRNALEYAEQHRTSNI